MDSGNDSARKYSRLPYGFDLLFLRRFCKIYRELLTNRLDLITFIALLLVALLEQMVVYRVGLISSGYYKVLSEKDLPGFWVQTTKAVALVVAISFIIATKQYLTSVLYVSWRRHLTQYLHRLYFSGIRYYGINVVENDIDNPDQRIGQDVDKMCKDLSVAVPVLVVSPFTICYYGYVTYCTSGYYGPLGSFLFFVFETAINKFLMSPVVDLVYLQEKCEGHFRYHHMHIRTNAEPIAFHDGGYAEMLQADQKLANLTSALQQQIVRQYPLSLSINVFQYIGSIVSFLLIAGPLYSGQYDSLASSDLTALISKNAFETIYLIQCFTQLVNLSPTFTEIAGTTHRIAQLIERLVAQQTVVHTVHHEDKGAGTPFFQLCNISYTRPDQNEPMLKGLTLTLQAGCSILVTGCSSSGKTSLFRVLKGLWPVNGGSIHRYGHVDPSQIFFLPQKPIMSFGTLRHQIMYPLDSWGNAAEVEPVASCEKIIRFLEVAELLPLLDRIGGLDYPVDWNWYDMLSPGELQRLCFVRLFYHKPCLAFLDEATSAVSYELEAKLYNYCHHLGITLVSAGHRQSLYNYHNKILHLDGLGGWTLMDSPSKLNKRKS